MSASAACPETGEACGRACGSRWCVLKARRVVAEQAAAELRVRRVPAQREDVEIALAIHERIHEDLAATVERVERDRRMDEHLAATVEAKAVHVERTAGAGPADAVVRLAAAGLTGPLNAKAVPAARSEVLTPREAPGGPAAEWSALSPTDAKGVNLGELTRTYAAVLGTPAPTTQLTAQRHEAPRHHSAGPDAVPDPLPLRAVPATDERPAAQPLPPVPQPAPAGMRFTWTPEERHP